MLLTRKTNPIADVVIQLRGRGVTVAADRSTAPLACCDSALKEWVPSLTDLLGGQEHTGFFAEVVAVLADSTLGGTDRLGFPGDADEQSAESTYQFAPGGRL